VLVTGTSSGIGAAIAQALACRGFTVGCMSRRGTVPDGGANLVSLPTDVRDAAATAAAVQALAAEAGPLVGLVNAAGVHMTSVSAEATLEELRPVMETNFYAAFTLAQQVYPHLVSSGGGLVVNIGSFYENLGVSGNLAYSASKAAMGAMTRCLAVEWAPDRVRMLDVAPGYVRTGLNEEYMSDPDRRARIERQIPARRLGTSDEIGTFVATLYSEPVPFLTGATLVIDGGHGIRL
jgi:NAD(P)-dependent dehydrogenase (short-subunit alcohol dehydrogenase family)